MFNFVIWGNPVALFLQKYSYKNIFVKIFKGI